MPPLRRATEESPPGERPDGPVRGRKRLPVVAAGLAYLAIAAAMTWPLLAAPSRLGFANMDVFGNVWTLAWDVHQGARDPLRLFDSNMFFPYTLSLAYAESLLPQALLAAPVVALGGWPLLAYNVVFILSFVMSGVGAYLLAEDVAGSAGGAFLAGLAFAFCAYRWAHVVHLQSLTVQWLPLALLSLRRLWRNGSMAAAAGLALFTTLQVLSSGYYALLMAIALGITMLAEWRRGGAPRNARRMVAALVVSGLCVLPVFAAYRVVQQRHGFTRGRDEAAAWSARPASYLDPGVFVGPPHLARLHSMIQDGEPLYPGTVIWVLAAVGIVAARGTLEAMWAAALTVTGFVLSLGPRIDVAGGLPERGRAFFLRAAPPLAADGERLRELRPTGNHRFRPPRQPLAFSLFGGPVPQGRDSIRRRAHGPGARAAQGAHPRRRAAGGSAAGGRFRRRSRVRHRSASGERGRLTRPADRAPRSSVPTHGKPPGRE